MSLASSEANQPNIRRARHNASDGYFLVSRITAQDKNLSMEALGTLIYLLSKPNDWIVKPTELVAHTGYGRDKIYRILNELIALRYIERIKTRDANNRVLSVDYIVHECPLPGNQDVGAGEKPLPCFPDTENPHTTIYRKDKEEPKTFNDTTVSLIDAPTPEAKDAPVEPVESIVERLVSERIDNALKQALEAASSTALLSAQAKPAPKRAKAAPRAKAASSIAPRKDIARSDAVALYESVEQHVFGIANNPDAPIGWNSPIGIITLWIQGRAARWHNTPLPPAPKQVTPSDIKKFAEHWHNQHQRITMPQSPDKFARHFTVWKDGNSYDPYGGFTFSHMENR